MLNVEEFRDIYRPDQASSWVSDQGLTLLHLAVGNTDPAARVAIANLLLDDGADAAAISPVESCNALHILFGHVSHDIPAEAALLRRLLEGGADVNWVSPTWGTPLETLMSKLKFSDDVLAPFYDEIFARPDVDLHLPQKLGQSTLQSARQIIRRRAGLVARMEDYLQRHGRRRDGQPDE